MKSVPNRKAWFCVSVHVHVAVWGGTFNYVITVCTRISLGNNEVNCERHFGSHMKSVTEATQDFRSGSLLTERHYTVKPQRPETN